MSRLEEQLAEELAAARARADGNQPMPEVGRAAPVGGEAAAIAAGKWVVPDRPRRLREDSPSESATDAPSAPAPELSEERAPAGAAAAPGLTPSTDGALHEQPPAAGRGAFRDRLQLEPHRAAPGPPRSRDAERAPLAREPGPSAARPATAGLLVLVALGAFLAGRMTHRPAGAPVFSEPTPSERSARLLAALDTIDTAGDVRSAAWAAVGALAAGRTPTDTDADAEREAPGVGRAAETEDLALRLLRATLAGDAASHRDVLAHLRARTLGTGGLAATAGGREPSPAATIGAVFALTAGTAQGLPDGPLDPIAAWVGFLLTAREAVAGLTPDDQDLAVVAASRLVADRRLDPAARGRLEEALTLRALAGPRRGQAARSPWPELAARALAGRSRLATTRAAWEVHASASRAALLAWTDRLAVSPRPAAQPVAEALLGLRVLREVAP